MPPLNPPPVSFEGGAVLGADGGTVEISRALASFVRSILSGNSPFGRFINGDRAALTAQQQAGLQLFRGKANCTACHVGPNFTDERLHNTGVAWREGKFADTGAGQGNFKTPTLREIARTAPYMHDGGIATLEDVIEYYDRGGHANPNRDPELRPLHLSSMEKQNLVAFLRCLHGASRQCRQYIQWSYMSSVEEIERAIQELSRDEFTRIAQRIHALEQDRWDIELDLDAKSGRLDFLIAEAREDLEQGRLRDWPGPE